MKHPLFDPLVVNPHDVARHDYLQFFVEEISAHRGDCESVALSPFTLNG